MAYGWEERSRLQTMDNATGFLDVVEHGYALVAVNIVLVAVLFSVLALGALAADKRLRGVRVG